MNTIPYHTTTMTHCPHCSHLWVLHRLSSDGPGCFGYKNQPSNPYAAFELSLQCACPALDTVLADLHEDHAIAQFSS